MYCFVSGFMFSNIKNGRADEKEEIFKKEFSQWVKEWLKSNKNIKNEDTLDYLTCINSVCCSQEEAVMLFLELAEKFFDEITI